MATGLHPRHGDRLRPRVLEMDLLEDCVLRAHDYVQEAIRTAPDLGHGNGPLNHLR